MMAGALSVNLERFVEKALRYRKQLVSGALMQLHDSEMVGTCEIRLIPLRAPSRPSTVVLQGLLQTFEVEFGRLWT